MLNNAVTIAVAGAGGVIGAAGLASGAAVAAWRPPALDGTAAVPTEVDGDEAVGVLAVGAVAESCAVAGGVLGGEAVVVDCDVVGVGADVAVKDVVSPVDVAVRRGPDGCVGCADVGGSSSVVDGSGELGDPVAPAKPPPVVGELPAGVVDDGAVREVGSELESPAVDVAAGVDEDPAGVEVAAALAAGFAVLSEVVLGDDEDDELAVPVASACAMPAPVISAAPNPTVIAEFVTHLGTSCAPGARCRPWLVFDTLAARAFALARFFTR